MLQKVQRAILKLLVDIELFIKSNVLFYHHMIQSIVNSYLFPQRDKPKRQLYGYY